MRRPARPRGQAQGCGSWSRGRSANRALEPLSKLAASKWLCERAWIGGLEESDEDACYRAMDWLLEVEDDLASRCTSIRLTC